MHKQTQQLESNEPLHLKVAEKVSKIVWNSLILFPLESFLCPAKFITEFCCLGVLQYYLLQSHHCENEPRLRAVCERMR